MGRFVAGADRSQPSLFPACVEDWIAASHSMRANMIEVISNRFCATRRLRMAYVITASRRGEPVRNTRMQRASAAVLAMRLADEGCDDIVIMDGTGVRLSIVEFRHKYLSGRSGPWRGRLS